MIRILVVDDDPKPEFVNDMANTISGGFKEDVQPLHLNPVLAFKGGDQQEEIRTFLNEIRKQATGFWDVAIIDINLHEVDLAKPDKLHLALAIAEAFREVNRSAIVMLYSGTLEKHVKDLISDGRPAEAALKRIFQAEIVGFVPRDSIIDEVYSALDAPSLLLRVDRVLTSNAALVVGPKESEFSGKTFLQLAASVRQQDKDGRRIAELTAEYGIACFVDLNR
jgi:hypothetical protein